MSGDEPGSVEVCPARELSDGDRVIVDAGETTVGVFNVDGEYVAVENVCAHQGGRSARGGSGPD